jgi:DNA-binding transcriptional regulator YiaG
MTREIDRYDATALVGLNVIVINGAKEVVDTEGDEPVTYVQVPDLEELSAAAALVRCLMPQKLRGPEMKALRKIADMTARELSEAMGGKTAIETISRWENEAEFAGGYAESVLRLAICERVKDRAPGIDYSADKLNRVKMVGNGKVDPKAVPPIELRRVLLRQHHRTNDSWTDDREAA